VSSHPAPTLWIVGTSVSIEDGGYVTRLGERAQTLGIPLRNLSVGDQTSVIGYMRVLGHRDEIKPTDVVVWEYSLLDTLLTEPSENIFRADDVHLARRSAWQCVLECGAALIVLLTPPKKYLLERSACEAIIANDAESLGLAYIDVRDLFAELGIHDCAAHYHDDRHPRHDSPVIAAMMNALIRHTLNPSRPSTKAIFAWVRKCITARWQWLGSEDIAKGVGLPAQTFRNSLVTIDAIPLGPGETVAVPVSQRIVAVGIVSAHDSGGLWCGHADCMPASTRLPEKLPYTFLLRVTGIPCKRDQISSITSATKHAYRDGVWRDYGQDLCSVPGSAGVFGILYEAAEARTTWWERLLSR